MSQVKKIQIRKIQAKIPRLEANGRFLPDTIDLEKRTVQFVFTTEMAVRMWNWEFGTFNEILSTKPNHIRIDRFKKGAPLLDNHDRFSGTRAQYGVVEDAWSEGDKFVGLVRFAKAEDDADADKVFRKVADGIIRNGSIGYRVYKYQDETKGDGKIKTMRAIDWEPVEFSIVTVPADHNAQVRSEQDQEIEIEIISDNQNERNLNMSKNEAEVPTPVPINPIDADKIRKEEREKNAKIVRACRQAKLPDKYAEELVQSGKSLENCLMEIQEKWAESDKETPIRSVSKTDVEVGEDNEVESRRAAIAEAILHRAAPQDHKMTDRAYKFSGLTAMEIVRKLLEINGVRVFGKSQDELIHRAFHSTSDFAAVLENVAGKRLQKAYESVPQIFKLFAEETTLRDFKASSVVHLGEAPALEELGDGGEITLGTMGDSKEVWQLATYAKGIAITRNTLINDDLGAFVKLSAAFGRAAAHLENKVALQRAFLDNPQLGDGKAIFHDDHNNLDETDEFISEASLGRLKALMRKQVDDKGQELELTPRWLVVGPDSETESQKILAKISKQGGFNVHGNTLDLLVTAKIDDYAHILIADKSAIEGLQYAYLEGGRGIQMRTISDPNVLGITIQAYLDFAAKAINHRAFVMNEGAAPPSEESEE